ncbi:universal stress protein [Spirillospora sp. NPDC047279]|uniref:universal stress protein n=1 Tax=Spirillospora sp. NPDC047279 TaxID=3155478 RepID=UPI003409E6FA
MTDPIIVGTDGSPHADRAVEWAADEAARRGLPLRIVHAAEPAPYTYPLLVAPESADALTNAGNEILAEAEKAARQRQGGIEVSTRLVMAAAGPALREESEGAFEVVIGHRGLGGFTSLLIGSTGLWMAGHASGPVVIVRDEPAATTDEIVVGVDLEGDDEETLRYAFETAALRGAPLRIVHAWQLSPLLGLAGYVLDPAKVVAEIRENLAGALAPWRERHPGLEIAEEIVQEHPAKVLCALSEQAALLVIGAPEHKLRRLGSIGHGVVQHAQSPVAVVRARSEK